MEAAIEQRGFAKLDEAKDLPKVSTDRLMVFVKKFDRLLKRPSVKIDRISTSDYDTGISRDSLVNKYRGAFFSNAFNQIDVFLDEIKGSSSIGYEAVAEQVKDLRKNLMEFLREYKINRYIQKKSQVEELKKDEKFIKIARGLLEKKDDESLGEGDWDFLVQNVLKTLGDNSSFSERVGEESLEYVKNKFKVVSKKHLNVGEDEINQMDLLISAAKRLAEEIIDLENEASSDYREIKKPINQNQLYAR